MIAVRLLVDGAVVREAVFRDDSALLGRGPESDFAIVDPSVSRRHARVGRDESGAVWIEDAGSRNGLRIGGRRVERASLPAVGSLRCQLGAAEVELTLSSADATLELAVPPSIARGPLPALKALALWIAAVAAVPCGIMIAPGFWSPWEQNRLATLASAAVGVAMGLPILAFVLTGLLRIVRRKARVSDALRALALVSWGWVLLTALLRAASYGLSVQFHGLLTTLLAGSGTVFTVAYLASTARHGPSRRFFLAWVAAMVLLLAGATGAGRLVARQAGTPQVDYDLDMPVAGFCGPASDLDGYMDALRADYARAEQRAAEERRYSDAARR